MAVFCKNLSTTHSIYFKKICDFLSSPFSPVMANLAAANSAGERESLESKLLRASSEKTSCLLQTVPLLDQCISKKNHGQLETDKELKILGKDFKKLMKENILLKIKVSYFKTVSQKEKKKNSSYDLGENEVLFLKIGTRVLDLWLDTSSGTKWCICSL